MMITTSEKRGLSLWTWFILLAALAVLLSACGPSSDETAETPQAEANVPVVVDSESREEATAVPADTTAGYPDPQTQAALPDPGYPAPTIEGLQPEPPNPEVNLPEAGSETAVVGGILIREITDQGFVPLIPRELILGEIVSVDTGDPAYVRTNADSLRAELFPTGIFIFRNVPPGEYGLVMDLGFSQFLIEGYTLTVEAGQVLDLGQVITTTPE